MKPYEDDCDLLVPWFLMACFAYYELGRPIMSDAEFDHLVGLLAEHWEVIDHPHKKLIDPEIFSVGSGFALDYPSIVRFSTMDLVNETA
jgi:NAD-dependent DNA ligase